MVERTALKNRLTSVADRTFPELSALVGGNDSATTRALMGRYGSAQAIARANILQLTKVVREASRGHHGREKAEEVKAAARPHRTFRSVTALAAVLGVVCALIGMLVSILLGTPVGSTIVMLDALAFALFCLVGKMRGR